MPTRIGIGLDNHPQGYTCGQEAAREAQAAMRDHSRPTFALLFTSHAQPESVLKGVNDALGDVPLIGATSAGEYTHQGYVEGGAGLMLFQADEIQFYPLLRQQGWFRRGNRIGPLHGISKEGLGSVYSHRTLMLFPDDQSMNLNGLVDQAMTETGLLYNILGGPGPTTHMPPRQPAVFHNRQMLRIGLAAAEILSQQPLGLALANGWTPTSGSYRVTQADDHRLIKLDGRPTREVYEDFFSDQNLVPLGSPIPSHLLFKYPVGMCEHGEKCVWRVSVGTGFDSSGSLRVMAPPAMGSLVNILHTHTESMLAGTQRAIQSAMQGLHDLPPAGLLFIDCMSTAMLLGNAYEQQRKTVQYAAGDTPFLGYRSHGVLARLQGQMAGHFDCSVATCVIPG